MLDGRRVRRLPISVLLAVGVACGVAGAHFGMWLEIAAVDALLIALAGFLLACSVLRRNQLRKAASVLPEAVAVFSARISRDAFAVVRGIPVSAPPMSRRTWVMAAVLPDRLILVSMARFSSRLDVASQAAVMLTHVVQTVSRPARTIFISQSELGLELAPGAFTLWIEPTTGNTGALRTAIDSLRHGLMPAGTPSSSSWRPSVKRGSSIKTMVALCAIVTSILAGSVVGAVFWPRSSVTTADALPAATSTSTADGTAPWITAQPAPTPSQRRYVDPAPLLADYGSFRGPKGFPIMPGAPWGPPCEPIVVWIDPRADKAIQNGFLAAVADAASAGLNITAASPTLGEIQSPNFRPSLGAGSVRVVHLWIHTEAPPKHADGHPFKTMLGWNAGMSPDGIHEQLTLMDEKLYTSQFRDNPKLIRTAANYLIAASQGISGSDLSGTAVAPSYDQSAASFSSMDVEAMLAMSGCR